MPLPGGSSQDFRNPSVQSGAATAHAAGGREPVGGSAPDFHTLSELGDAATAHAAGSDEPASLADVTPTHSIAPIAIHPAASGKTPPLRELASQAPKPAEPGLSAPRAAPRLRPGRAAAPPATRAGADPLRQLTPGSTASLSQIASFDGARNLFGYFPSDPNGDIGYDPATGRKFYFEWINVFYEAWDVTDTQAPVLVVPPTSGNTLWAAALPSSPCAFSNDGDPIALFDEQAHRWLISQFSVNDPFHQCVAVSQSADPTGAWFVYDYPYAGGATYFNDYPKFGVWPDHQFNAYFMSADQFDTSGSIPEGAGVAAFDRAAMLAGDPNAAMIFVDLFPVQPLFTHLLPADLDGVPPPGGTPGFFVTVDNNVYKPDLGADALRIWEFRPDFTQPASSSFGVDGTPNYTLPVAAFTMLPCVMSNSSDCIPQPGLSSSRLDSLGDRPMYRAAFRTVGAQQSLVLNHTVLADGIDRSGSRWYELQRNPAGGAWNIAQQSTYAPADGIYRWMGSMAMDRQGDMALGYSASSLSLYPSIRYTGRLVGDTPSTLPQTEMTLTAGGGVQSANCPGVCERWGDYTMLGVDPQDGCTFWYVNEYYVTTGGDWHTRIGAFRFPQCVPQPVGSLSGTVVAASNSAPISGSVVTAVDTSGVGTFVSAPANAAGQYRLAGIPAGTFTLTATAAGFVTRTVASVLVSSGVTTTQNFTLSVYGAALAPPAAARGGMAGATVTYTLQLTNIGFATDSYTITVSGNVWAVSAPTSSGPLAPNATAVITVGVTISPGAAFGASDSAVITATSHADPSAWAASVLYTFRALRWYFPIMLR